MAQFFVVGPEIQSRLIKIRSLIFWSNNYDSLKKKIMCALRMNHSAQMFFSSFFLSYTVLK
jgi:hypothetical protein